MTAQIAPFTERKAWKALEAHHKNIRDQHLRKLFADDPKRGERSLEKRGKKKWRRHVADVIERLIAALEPDDVVLGGGNVKKLKDLPKGCREGDNANAFVGGFRMWEKADDQRRSPAARARNAKKRKKRRLTLVTGARSAAVKKAS